MIKVEGLRKSYGRVEALMGVSLMVERGEVLGVLGPSGSGKTSLLRLIAGLEWPDEGSVSIDSETASTPEYLLEPHRRGISVVFQTPSLWPHMTAEKNLLYTMGAVPEAQASRRAGALLEAAGLKGLGGRYPHELSGGEARRVSVARGLAPRKRYVLMDEPLVNLDPELKRSMLALVGKEVREAGSGMIYVTHDRDELDGLADRVIHLRRGRVEETE